MTKRRLPSELISDIKSRLERIERTIREASQQVGYVSKIVTAGEPYWRALDEEIERGQLDPLTSTSYNFLESFNEQVRRLERRTRQFDRPVLNLAGTVSIYADVTATDSSLSPLAIDYDREHIKRMRYSFDVHDDYSIRLADLDPALSKTFNAIKEAYYGQSSDPLRIALSQIRQTFNHFFNLLVPSDSEITKQSWWAPANPNKPKDVSRTQRIRFAAQKHVKDRNMRQVLINGADHMNDVYN